MGAKYTAITKPSPGPFSGHFLGDPREHLKQQLKRPSVPHRGPSVSLTEAFVPLMGLFLIELSVKGWSLLLSGCA